MSLSSHEARPKRTPTQTQADTAKASQRDALGSFFGSFCSQKEQFLPVANDGWQITRKQNEHSEIKENSTRT